MEKRAILAVILSLAVLYTWGVMFPPPKPASKPSSDTQAAENKEDISGPALVAITKDEPVIEDVAAEPSVSEEIHVVETDVLSARFSNVGGALKSVTIRKHDVSLPVTDILSIPGYTNKPFQRIQSQDNLVVYQYQAKGVRITKKYKLYKDDHLFKGEIIITNLSKMSKQASSKVEVFNIDLSSLDKKDGSFARDQMLMEYAVSMPQEIFRKRSASKFAAKEERKESGFVNWAGYRDRYFCTIIKPEFTATGYEVEAVDSERLKLLVSGEKKSISGSESISYEFLVFVGPQDIKLLKSYDMGFESFMDFGTGNFLDIMAFGMTDPIARILLAVLNFLYMIIPNWGVCIIILAGIVYGGTYPLTHKSLSSMKKMQVLQPEMIKLREKHKDNPEKLNREVMDLYKRHKVNPLGGCLPMLVQYPVFVGLYQLLWRYVAFKGAGFLWIKDLSEPDRLFTLKNSLPFIGNEINVLPVIFVILMIIQQKVSTGKAKGMDPTQEATQKMMMKILPVFIFVVFYKIASGIALYFSMVSVLSIIAQKQLSKKIKVVADGSTT